MEVEIVPPSAAQMRKLHVGHPFRAKMGKGLKIHVSPSVGKKLMKASKMGVGATVDGCSCMGCGMCGRGLVKKSTEFAEAARPYTVNKTVSPIKQAASTSSVSAISKKKGKGLVKKSAEFSEAARPYTVNKTVSPIKQAASTSAVTAISSKKGGMLPQGRRPSVSPGAPRSYVQPSNFNKLDAELRKNVGGKISRRKKFNQWFKDIGQKFKPIAKNLKPIKEAATERAADYIRYEGNPQAQAQSIIDMGQQEYKDTRKLGKKRSAAPGSASAADDSVPMQMEEMRRGTFMQPTLSAPAPQAVDINDDGESDGYFFPNERSWFGAGMKGRKKGKGMGELTAAQKADPLRTGRMAGRPTTMPVVRPAPALKAKGVKKSSAWIDHVKAYCAKHGCKYGEGLKRAKATYKKSGGALYPAGYVPVQY